MSLPREEKQIVLTLTNSSSLNSSTVSLFKLPSVNSSSSSGSSSTSSGQQISINNSIFGAGNWTFNYNTSLSYLVISPTDIDDLVSKLNAVFTENGQGIFWKETGTGGVDWFLRVASSLYVFINAQIPLNPTKTFVDFGSGFISGTTTSVTVGYSTVTYNSITSELSVQPYFITTIYIRPTTFTQLQYPFSVNLLDPNGVASTRPIQPIIDPTQSQSVNVSVPMYMPTGALNEIQYTIEASGSVLMIIQYEHIDLIEAGRLIDSGKFQREMSLLKEQDEENYHRIMETISTLPNGLIKWAAAESENKSEEKPVVNTFAVPLIYVVAINNGNNNVKML